MSKTHSSIAPLSIFVQHSNLVKLFNFQEFCLKVNLGLAIPEADFFTAGSLYHQPTSLMQSDKTENTHTRLLSSRPTYSSYSRSPWKNPFAGSFFTRQMHFLSVNWQYQNTEERNKTSNYIITTASISHHMLSNWRHALKLNKKV